MCVLIDILSRATRAINKRYRRRVTPSGDAFTSVWGFKASAEELVSFQKFKFKFPTHKMSLWWGGKKTNKQTFYQLSFVNKRERIIIIKKVVFAFPIGRFLLFHQPLLSLECEWLIWPEFVFFKKRFNSRLKGSNCQISHMCLSKIYTYCFPMTYLFCMYSWLYLTVEVKLLACARPTVDLGEPAHLSNWFVLHWNCIFPVSFQSEMRCSEYDNCRWCTNFLHGW